MVVGWVFFRSTDFGMATALLNKMVVPTGGLLGNDVGVALAFLSVAAVWAMRGPNAFELFQEFRWRAWHGYAVAAAMGWCLTIIGMGRNSPFLYFQF